MTNNRARTAPDLRAIFEKNGGNLATTGSVAFQFSKQGVITVRAEGADEESLMDLALTAGAEDLRDEGEVFEIYTPADKFHAVREAVDASGVTVEDAAIADLPMNTVPVEGEAAAIILKLIDLLEDNDDVQSVSHNAEIPESAVA